MVSFCDIPLTRTQDFTKRYGNHAIGLTKEWALKNEVNPILYIHNKLIAYYDYVKTKHFICGFVKQYNGEHKGKAQCNYEENEWRYVVEENDNIQWKWSEDQYKNWRGTGKKKNQADSYLSGKKLSFGVDDISYIIVEHENQRGDIIEFINKMTSVGGASTTIDRKERLKLISKIISIEQIKKDF
jgi:hypothetical protein